MLECRSCWSNHLGKPTGHSLPSQRSQDPAGEPFPTMTLDYLGSHGAQCVRAIPSVIASYRLLQSAIPSFGQPFGREIPRNRYAPAAGEHVIVVIEKN
jgi:hypothetical protein